MFQSNPRYALAVIAQSYPFSFPLTQVLVYLPKEVGDFVEKLCSGSQYSLLNQDKHRDQLVKHGPDLWPVAFFLQTIIQQRRVYPFGKGVDALLGKAMTPEGEKDLVTSIKDYIKDLHALSIRCDEQSERAKTEAKAEAAIAAAQESITTIAAASSSSSDRLGGAAAARSPRVGVGVGVSVGVASSSSKIAGSVPLAVSQASSRSIFDTMGTIDTLYAEMDDVRESLTGGKASGEITVAAEAAGAASAQSDRVDTLRWVEAKKELQRQAACSRIGLAARTQAQCAKLLKLFA